MRPAPLEGGKDLLATPIGAFEEDPLSTTRHIVTTDEALTRLDRVLAALPSVGSRERARRALATGKVHVDGAPVAADAGGHPVAEGSVVEIRWNQASVESSPQAPDERTRITVLHEDDAVLVVDKPAGLLTDAATREQHRRFDTLRKQVRAWLGTREVWPAHRIDRDTSGAVVFAKTPAARQSLHDQWVARRPLRAYLVVVEGSLSPDAGHLADWMRWDRRARRQTLVHAGADEAWLAEADYTVVQRFGDRATQLEVQLISGRRNQIRLHFQRLGHPLVGETLYRPGSRPRVRFPRQALHAHRLGFDHPTDGSWLEITAPVPSDLARLLRRLAT